MTAPAKKSVPKKISIVEVGPRDGLQNEKMALTLQQKLEFIRLLTEAGHKRIEIGAFVNPQKVPQMADTVELSQQLARRQGVRYSALVPNQQGFDVAMANDIREIAVFIAVSDTFNQKNINSTTAQALQRFAEFLPQAKKNKCFVRSYVSTAFGCPFEGTVKPAAVIKLCEQLLALGVEELAISDTIGVAAPHEVVEIIRMLEEIASLEQIAIHFHDTRGTGLANAYAAIMHGITTIDASAAGLGGCPFAPKATGNLATDDLLYMLQRMGIASGIDLNAHVKASLYMQACMGRQLPSRFMQTLLT